MSAEERPERRRDPKPRPRPAGSQGFPKRRRLRKRREFLAVQSVGRAIHGRYFLVVAVAASPSCARLPADAEGRVGITVSKKVGSAVKRNRIKRLVREYLRRHEFAPALDVVVIAKRSAGAVGGYREVARDLDGLGGRLGERLEGRIP
jgi:ribonuclease P protein component